MADGITKQRGGGSQPRPVHPPLEQPVIVVANRLPVSRSGDSWRRSSGGLVTALAPIMASSKGAWVGWDGGSAGTPQEMPGLPVQLVALELDRPDITGYYHGFSNRTIWPLFHDLIHPARYDRTWWRHYVSVNERFAEKTLEHLRRRDDEPVVWVHDYHLMLVPAMLRSRFAGRIIFFLHIPFPPPELFSRLPWRADILRGLLGADVVSFHTDRYRKNFVRTCGRLIQGLHITGRRITTEDGRPVTTNGLPISIDAEEFSTTARSPEVATELAALKEQFNGKKVLLGVDRLDYTKGIPERLDAFEQLLERRSDLRRDIALVQIAVPTRSSVREYRELRSRVEQSVGRINGRFTEPGGDVPIHYIHRGVSRQRLVAYYSLADVMVVTPLKDGMNLVAKEYVSCQHAVGGSGTLLLSEFTGAALELKEAVSCNPFDTHGLSREMETALEQPDEVSRKAIGAMGRRVAKHDVHRWAKESLLEPERPTSSRLPADAHL